MASSGSEALAMMLLALPLSPEFPPCPIFRSQLKLTRSPDMSLLSHSSMSSMAKKQILPSRIFLSLAAIWPTLLHQLVQKSLVFN